MKDLCCRLIANKAWIYFFTFTKKFFFLLYTFVRTVYLWFLFNHNKFSDLTKYGSNQ